MLSERIINTEMEEEMIIPEGHYTPNCVVHSFNIWISQESSKTTGSKTSNGSTYLTRIEQGTRETWDRTQGTTWGNMEMTQVKKEKTATSVNNWRY